MSSGGYSLVPGSEKLYYYNNDAEYQAEQAPALKAGAPIGNGIFTMEASADGTGFTATFPRLTNNGTYVLQYEATINHLGTVRSGVTFHNDALINAKLYTGGVDIHSDGSGDANGDANPTPTPSVTPTPTPSTPSPATPPATPPAQSTPAPKQLARTGADMAGVLAGTGVLGLLGALAVAARRRGA